MTFTTKRCKDSVLVLSAAKILSSDSLIPRLSPRVNEKERVRYCKRWKAGCGLGTRLLIRVVCPISVSKVISEHLVLKSFPGELSLPAFCRWLCDLSKNGLRNGLKASSFTRWEGRGGHSHIP